ncbi:hypothetical protein [Enterococcus faecium]|uniref:hypothetical protein n=1 Tax=Enterococcus faecium TaxID=1352 RepID=UPI000A669105|nr:hypothetical protein [Enterococcus faecium]GER97820.1 hypothetical protein EfmAA708_28550 [Enterococcus faecium]
MKQILRSKMIFDGEQPPFKGYIVINEGIIEKVENNWNYSDLLPVVLVNFFLEENV